MHHGAFEQLTIRTVDEWVLPLLHHIYKLQICITVTVESRCTGLQTSHFRYVVQTLRQLNNRFISEVLYCYAAFI